MMRMETLLQPATLHVLPEACRNLGRNALLLVHKTVDCTDGNRFTSQGRVRRCMSKGKANRNWLRGMDSPPWAWRCCSCCCFTGDWGCVREASMKPGAPLRHRGNAQAIVKYP